VGKSSILNRIMGKELAETGEISQKLGRGKNTTRHAELFALEGGGHIFDTPGFTSFDLEALKQGGKRGEDTMEEQDLAHYYPEMAALLGNCRYDNCRHISEPDCRIREAVEDGRIHRSRYESYCVQMEELKNRKKY
ncbi:MAG: ribosome small subunit-dependent GTPase A, partial [Firmicutes bacterium]|nr:ribosome small subunit-dependent GTPase A [Bacillota bacterium]